MKKLFIKNRYFLIPFLLIWVLLAILLLSYSKAEIHLFSNQFHSDLFNTFFHYITYLGDGIFPAIVAVLLLLISFRKAFIIGLGAVLAGVLSQFFKRIVFPDILRPKAFFENIDSLFFVPGVEIHSYFSFPSGHTTTAFCLFFVLGYFTTKPIYKIFILLLALITAFSRIYLSQHFLIDVYFGALLGVFAALVSIIIMEKPNVNWLDKSLITVFKKNE